MYCKAYFCVSATDWGCREIDNTFVWRGTLNYHLAGLLDTIDTLYKKYNTLLSEYGYGAKYDLAKALRISPSRGRNYTAFANSRKIVSNVIDGKVEYDEGCGKWFYKNNKNQKFSIGATSEGVKKIAIMDRLLANGYLDSNSIIFIDEIESALHPKAVCQFLDMVDTIANDMGLQVFVTSRSYFVIKKLYLIALKKAGSVSCISLNKGQAVQFFDLHDGMPKNSIIDTSIRLYEQEIEEVL